MLLCFTSLCEKEKLRDLSKLLNTFANNSMKQMESFNSHKLKPQKANKNQKHHRQLRKIAKLFHYVEMCLFLVLISRISFQLPMAVKNTSEYLHAFVSPHLVFLVGNLIIVALFAQFGQFSATMAPRSNLYQEFLHNSFMNRKIQAYENSLNVKGQRIDGFQEKQSAEKQRGEKQSTEKQSKEKQSTEKQSMEIQGTKRQSREKQSMEIQGTKKQSREKQRTEEQIRGKQSMGIQGTKKQSRGKQSTEEQSGEKQSMEIQGTKKQSREKQSTEELSREKQSMLIQGTKKQSREKQSTEKQSIEEQVTEKQSSEKQSGETGDRIKRAEKHITKTITSLEMKDYRRCKSDVVREVESEKPTRVLQRCETESRERSSYPEDGMSNEEFRRAVEAFIARQQRNRTEDLCFTP